MNTPRKSVMTYTEHARASMRLGLPLIGGHLAQIAIGVTDTLMLGWYSVEALAATALGGGFFFLFFIVGSGFGIGVMPLVAEAEAKGDDVAVRRITRMGNWLSILFGLIALPAFVFSAPWLRALGQPPEIASLAQDYLRIAGLGIVPALMVMVLKSYLAALERTRVVFWVTALATGINVFVNYALIFGNWGFPELGVRGAAISSVLVQVVSLLGVSGYAVFVLPHHQLFSRIWRIDRDVLRTVFRIGVPIGMTNLAEVGLFTMSSVMMGWLGTVALAAHGIALQIAAIAFMIHVGLSNVATIRAGNALGRKDVFHLARGAKTSIALSVILSLLVVLLFVTLPDEMVSLFLDPDDPQREVILVTGVALILVAAIFQFFDGAQVVALGLLRGVQDTRVPMIMAVISYWGVGLPTSYLLGIVWGYGGVGVWLGLVVGLATAAVLLMARFWISVLPKIRQGFASP